MPKHIGPFPVLEVHVNGTLTILIAPGVEERVNIRRVWPHRP